MEEIEEERRKVALSREDELGIEDTGEDTGIVMVACKDERSCLQLEACITKGPHQVCYIFKLFNFKSFLNYVELQHNFLLSSSIFQTNICFSFTLYIFWFCYLTPVGKCAFSQTSFLKYKIFSCLGFNSILH